MIALTWRKMTVNILCLKYSINAKARGYDDYKPTGRYITQRRRV